MPSNWQAMGAGGLFGGTSAGAGGVMPRSDLDARRMGVGRIPSAEYPDGYLGTIQSRREDRLLDSLKNREGQRSYVRGVHKGERIDPGDYLWPSDLLPERGLANEAKGRRTAPRLDLVPHPHLTNDGKADPVNATPAVIDDRRASQLASLRPTWR